jgi:hypothetical protein
MEGHTLRDGVVVVVTSKGRPANAKHMLTLFPDAKFYVDEAERDDYLPYMEGKEEQFVGHPSLRGQQRAMNYALDREDADAILFCDDDLDHVKSLVNTWPRKDKNSRYTDASDLAQFVDTGYELLLDMGIHLYGWNKQPHPLAYNNCQPYSMNRLVQGAVLLRRGSGFRFDEKTDHWDADITLYHLLKDRILYKDNRIYWHFGFESGNVGGNQSVMTSDIWIGQREYMQEKWCKYFETGGSSVAAKVGGAGGSKAGAQEGFGVTVSRKSSLAIRR